MIRGVGGVLGLLLTVLGTLALAIPAQAQTLRGRLLDDETGEGIAEGRVVLLEPDSSEIRSVLTDSLGSFLLPVPALGRYYLRADRIGYGSVTSQLFAVATMDTTAVEFRIAADAIPLTPLAVLVNRRSGRELFDDRKALDRGVLLDPAMVDSLRPSRHTGEILRHVDKVRVRWSWGYHENGGSGPIPGVRTYLGDGCVRYVVDNYPVPPPFFSGVSQWGVAPLSTLEPEDIVAVEVYRSIWEVPEGLVDQLEAYTLGERQTLRAIRSGTCGIVVFWTERGW